MENQERIAGGIFVAVLMFFLLNPLTNDIQAAAAAAGSAEWIRAIAPQFPLLWVSFIFIILAFTGYDIFKNME